VQLIVEQLALEQLVVPRQLAQDERIDVAVPLDRRVAVDREHLHAAGALGLQHRWQKLEREIDDVVGFQRHERTIYIRDFERTGQRAARSRSNLASTTATRSSRMRSAAARSTASLPAISAIRARQPATACRSTSPSAASGGPDAMWVSWRAIASSTPRSCTAN